VRAAIIRTGLETLYFTGAHLLLKPFLSGVGAIFMLHHVRPARRDSFQPNRLLEVTPKFLTEVVSLLRRWNVELVSLDEMHRRLTERDFAHRFACITFDDGYRDNKDFAYPILKKEGVPFAIYVPTSFPDRLGKLWWVALEAVIARNTSVGLVMDGKDCRFACATAAEKRTLYEGLYWWLRELPTEAEMYAIVGDLAARYSVDVDAICAELCMDWNELTELARDPLVTIGAHTVNHVMLAKATDAVVRSEIKMGQTVLEAALGRRPVHLAYPYGGRDVAGPREFRIAKELGFKTAVTTRPGMLYAAHVDHFAALPRLSVNGQFQQGRYLRVLMSGAATALWNGFRRVDAA
jgi:peptidoglycan/xylan/chitin deacetylase (PgdA/CDA1 family)